MTGPTASISPETFDDKAVEWLVRVQSDVATEQDWAALTAWLDEAPEHLAAFERVEALAAELDDLAPHMTSGLSSAAPFRADETTAEVLPFTPKRPPARRWTNIVALCGAIAATLLVAPLLKQSYEGKAETYQTQIGETRNLTLSDGSKIQLNGASKVTVQLGWRQRSVTMADAEASFDVAKDAARPFVISVGDQQVRVVGTAFNIRHFDGTVGVTVRRGVVEVRQLTLGQEPIARLTFGDDLQHQVGTRISTLSKVDPNGALAWTTGRLIYNDKPLSLIVSDLNRHFIIPIRLSTKAKQKRFSGLLLLKDQESLVRRLALVSDLTMDRTAREFVLR